jgi:tryptophan 7-halogenase
MSLMKTKNITIVGGGTAGWMTAAALSRYFRAPQYNIVLIESDAIGTVGVGEATVPHIRYFNNMLGIDEQEFIRETQATYKLGIQFEDWGAKGESYLHPFGSHGYDINGVPFHHYWIKLRQQNGVADFDNFSMAVVAARKKRFSYPLQDGSSPLSTFTYAFHINANAYAAFLRRYAEARDLVRIEGKIQQVTLDALGNIASVSLEDGQVVDGDLFIDCSGFRGLLIAGALKVGYESWAQWLLCDRAIAIPSTSDGSLNLYTRAIARQFGWQWQIPLQHRTGNGYVYASQFISDDQACDYLLSQLGNSALAKPNFLRFSPGRRQQSWSHNCVAIGLSSGFLEPLESTSIYLIQIAIMKLLEFFPANEKPTFKRNEFNRQIKNEYEKVRDFIILHYHLNRHDDSELWKYCANMDLPDELARKNPFFIPQVI